MKQINSTTFNIEPLVIEIENVIKNGLSVIFKDYTERFELLEKTNKQIMILSSLCDLNTNTREDIHLDDYECGNYECGKYECCKNNNNNDDKIVSIPDIINIPDITSNLVRKEIAIIENKLDKIEKKYELVFSPLIDKILNKLELLNDDIKELKQNSMNEVKPFIIKPSIVSSCENENIQFEIKEVEIIKKEELINTENNNVETPEENGLIENESIASEEEESVASEEESVASEEEESVASEEDEEESVASEEDEEEEVETEASEEEEEEVETEAIDEEEEELETEAIDEEEEEVETEAIVEDDDEDAELTIITIDDIDYCTNNEENGFIYEINEEGEQGDKVGYLKDSKPFFNADKK
jgi:hypothetical protein